MEEDGFDFNALRSLATTAQNIPNTSRSRPEKQSVFSFISQSSQQKKLGLSSAIRPKNREPDENQPETPAPSTPFKMLPFARPRQYAPEQASLHTPGILKTPRSHSRQHSSADLSAEIDDIDLQEIMNRKMKETALIKSQLAEERINTSNLKSQLASLQQTNDGLQTHLQSLETSSSQHLSDLQSAEEQLHQTQHALTEVQSNLAEAQLELSQAQSEGERARQDHLDAIRQREEELKRLKADYERASRKVGENEERVEKIKRLAKKGLDDLSAKFDTLQKNFETLLSQHTNSQSDLQQTRDEIESLRNSSEDQMKSKSFLFTFFPPAAIDVHSEMEPILNDSGPYFAKGLHTRNVIEELQNDKNSAEQVNDLLRGKLHIVSTQLAEAKTHISELEEAERRHSNALDALGTKIGLIVEKMSTHEKEELVLLAEASGLGAKLKEANERIAELDPLIKEKQELVSVVENQTKRIADLEGSLQRLHDLEQRSRQQENDIVKLEESNKTLREKNAQLTETLTTSQGLVSDLEQQIRKLDLQKVQEVGKKEHALEKIEVMKEDTEKLKTEWAEKVKTVQVERDRLQVEKDGLKKECNHGEERLAKLTTQMAVLQERFDSQNLSLKLAKENSGDMQERLLQSEISYTAKSEAATAKFSTDIALLQEQKSALQDQNTTLQSSLTRLEETIAAKVATEKAKLEAVTAKFTGDIALLQEQKAALQEQITGLQSKLTRADDTTSARVAAEKAVLQSQNASLQASVNRLEDELKVVATEFEKRTEQQEVWNDKLVSAHREALLSSTADFEKRLEHQENRHLKLLETQENRTLFAEGQAKEAMDTVTTLRERLRAVEVELATCKLKKAEVEASGKTELGDEVVRLQQELERCGAVIAELMLKEETLQQRYKDGQLSAIEKAFVASVIQMSQTMYEQDIVAKENELRRRDNMITALQTKVHKLESTLAKRLKEKGQEGGTDAKSILNLSAFMSSSPAMVHADVRPDTTAQISPSPVIKTQSAEEPSGGVVLSPPMKTFAKLASAEDDDISDSDGEQTLQVAQRSSGIRDDPRISSGKGVKDSTTRSALGKHGRQSSPGSSPLSPPPRQAQDDDPRPTRKSKVAARKGDEKKATDSGPKSKPRRRR